MLCPTGFSWGAEVSSAPPVICPTGQRSFGSPVRAARLARIRSATALACSSSPCFSAIVLVLISFSAMDFPSKDSTTANSGASSILASVTGPMSALLLRRSCGCWQFKCSRGGLVEGCVPPSQFEQFLPQLFGFILPCPLPRNL